MGEELIDQVALSLIPGLGPVTIKQLISYCGNASGVFAAKKSQLRKIPGIGTKTIRQLTNANPHIQAVEQLKIADTHGVHIISFTDNAYPKRLRQIEAAPTVLYVKGLISALNNQRSIGIVGTRKATKYGLQVLQKVLKELEVYKPTIVSGLAYGIDIAAHREAIKRNMSTIGVLGNSLEKIYPEAHTPTATQMLINGGIISELKFGTKAEPFYFPARNRIIAGLSDVLLLVEARSKGGAMITADYAKSYNRPCFAIPGGIDSPASEGCNVLIKSGQAKMLTRGKDLVEVLKWSEDLPENILHTDSSVEQLIISMLKSNPEGLYIDELCRKTLVPINKMGSFILNLELRGTIKALPGKKFTLVGQ